MISADDELPAPAPATMRPFSLDWLWVNIGRVMRIARKHQLQSHELLGVRREDDGVLSSDAFNENWAREIQKHARLKQELLDDGGEPDDFVPPPSMPKALWPLMKRMWLKSAVLFLISIGLTFIGPLLLGQTVGLIESYRLCEPCLKNISQCDELLAINATAANITLPVWATHFCRRVNVSLGYVFAFAMLASKLVESLTASHHMHLMMRLALRVRVVLVSAIYRKCLWLSGLGGASTSTGQIQNLMANDTTTFLMLAPMFNQLWAAPLQIIISFVWLAVIIGPSFLAGVAVMVACVPVQATIMKGYFRYRVAMLKCTDERVKLMNEMVQGVRIIKMYAWERTMEERIMAIRNKELRCIRGQRLLSCWLSVLMVCQPLFVTVATFSVYGSYNELKASVVLQAVSLLGMLRFPLAMLPFLLMQVANLSVSRKRIERFLLNPELSAPVKARALASSADLAAEIAREAAPAGSATEPSLKAGLGVPVPRGGGGLTPQDSALSSSGSEDLEAGLAVLTAAPTAAHTAGLAICGSYRWPKPESEPPLKHQHSSPPGTPKSPRFGRRSKERRKSKDPPRPVEPLALVDLELDFPTGRLTMVAGPVGSGKSSLLATLLGELDPDAATKAVVSITGRSAYFSQTPFILNDTVRANILLASPMNQKRYQETLRACALLPDLRIFPGGDMTQIGEKGMSLSGGQKARIALARACYARTPVVLLDDPLSAVDAHVGKHLFREAIGPRGLLAGSTTVLVTHQTQYLPFADHVVLMDRGRVLAQGSYRELRARERAGQIQLSSLGLGAADEAAVELQPDLVDERDDAEGTLAGDEPTLRRCEIQAGNEQKEAEGSVITKEEVRATGTVPWRVYGKYMKTMGGWPLVLPLVLLCTWDKFVQVATDYWLTIWIAPEQSFLRGLVPDSKDLGFWLPIYIGGAVAAGVSVYWRSFLLQIIMGLRSARVLYAQLSAAVIAAPMLFFETTPSGRILNRFTSDTQQVDFQLLMTLSQWINTVFQVLGALVLISAVNPIFLATLPVFIIIYTFAYLFSAPATRDLQRLESVSRSPLFSHFSETLQGLSTIRAYGATARFEATNAELLACNTRVQFNQDLAAQWVALRLDLISSLIVFLSILLPILTMQFGGSGASAAAFGLVIAYSLELSAFLKFMTRTTLDLQKGMAAVERIAEYIDELPPEPKGGAAAPEGVWPPAGRIVATNMCVRYRPELPLALKHVSCTIEARAKVGVVGRTGSGKSTFVSALWRLVEPTCGAEVGSAVAGGEGVEVSGALQVDGTDLSTLNLTSLRSRLAIIPQDPVLFQESLRYNLDPFGEHTDEALHRALELVQMTRTVSEQEKGLGMPVGEGGGSLSVGQRQLVCLARATLRDSKVVVLDEATASIDNETDAVLQAAIREMFTDATVLTIAHRLHTIMDSTEIMLFEAGELKEHAPPTQLLDDPASRFSALVRDTGSAAGHLRGLAFAVIAKGRLAKLAKLTKAAKPRE